MAVLLGSRLATAADPVLSEILASNKHTNKDEDGDSSDWIEIRNPGAEGIRLGGYYLTDARDKPTRWKFPDVLLPGNGYVLVWASGKDRADAARPLHTNFKLAESGEYLALVKPDGVTVASDFGPGFPPQTADVSYGVPATGGPHTFLRPTPGTPNRPALRAADVQFDHIRGLYAEPFRLALSTAAASASIRYTTDGSMPTPTTGTPYTGPIAVNDTVVVHAIADEPGVTSTAIISQTYIFPARVLHQPDRIAGYPNPNEPVTNPGPHEVDVPLPYGMDPTVINDPENAGQALKGLSEIPSLSIGVNPTNVFGPRGFYDTPRGPDEAKYPISFEYIDPGHPDRNVGVNAAITGHSKQKLKRSFHVHFSAKYGGPSKLHARLFNSPTFDGGATDEFTDLILRGGNNRSWATTGWPSKTTYTEDEYVRDTQIAMTGHGVHGTFVHLYINGIYWGLYNLVERPDAGYGQAYFGSKKGDYFSVSQNGVESGDPARWNYMVDTLAKQDMSVPDRYAEMRKYLDVKQFADYLIGQWFCGVSDWPDTNYWAGGDTSQKQPFQFFSWDGEEMLDTVNRFPTVPHGPWVNPAFARVPVKRTGPIVKLWTSLKRSPEFMAMFEGEVRKNVTGDGPLSDAKALARWDALDHSIGNAIVDESARWGRATASTGRPTYTKNNAWLIATRAIANDLRDADARFIAALRAEGYYP